LSAQSGNQYLDRFVNHAVHAMCAAFELSLNAAEDRAAKDLTELNSTYRLRLVLERLRLFLRDADPLLVPIAALDNLTAGCINATSELNAFSSDGAAGHLANANSHGDALLIYLAQAPALARVDDTDGAGAVARFRDAAQRHLDGIRTDADAARVTVEVLRTHIAALESEIAAQKARLDGAIGQFQAQASTAEAERTIQFGQGELNRQTAAATAEDLRKAHFTSAAEERKAAFDGALATATQAFAVVETRMDTSETSRERIFDAAIQEQKKDFTSTLDSARKSVDELSSELKADAEKVVSSRPGRASACNCSM